MSKESLQFHRLANIFPLVEGVRFFELVEDLRSNGLREPITIFDGQILDGRNRYRACHAAQVACRFKTFDGKDPLAFVVSANLHRRHLDTSQRAMIVAELCSGQPVKRGAPRLDGRRDRGGRLLPPLKQPGRKHIARANSLPMPPDDRARVGAISEMMNVNPATVNYARKVLDEGVQGLVDAVKSGEVSVSAAKNMLELTKEQQRVLLEKAGAAGVTTIGREKRAQKLTDRRTQRAAKGSSPAAVFDHLKFGDGRSIGNIRVGEIERLIKTTNVVLGVLTAVLNHSANASHSERIRDVLTAAKLSEIISAATGVEE